MRRIKGLVVHRYDSDRPLAFFEIYHRFARPLVWWREFQQLETLAIGVRHYKRELYSVAARQSQSEVSRKDVPLERNATVGIEGVCGEFLPCFTGKMIVLAAVIIGEP